MVVFRTLFRWIRESIEGVDRVYITYDVCTQYTNAPVLLRGINWWRRIVVFSFSSIKNIRKVYKIGNIDILNISPHLEKKIKRNNRQTSIDRDNVSKWLCQNSCKIQKKPDGYTPLGWNLNRQILSKYVSTRVNNWDT